MVGQSGSGKTTVTALLQRFYDAERGQVFVGGKDVRDLDLEWLRANVATVSQDATLLTGTVAECIQYGAPPGREVTGAEVWAAAEAANVTEWASQFPDGLDTPLGEKS